MNINKTIILFFLICIQSNIHSQRKNYFSVGTKYLTPIYGLNDDVNENVEGIASTFNTIEGGLNIIKWLRIGGFISLNNQSRKLLNAAVQIGIKNIAIHYETGNFEGFVDNTIPLLENFNEGTPIKIGNFSNRYSSIAILKDPGGKYNVIKYGIGVSFLTIPTQAVVQLDDSYSTISYIDPKTKINFYGFAFRADMMYLKLENESWTNGFGVDVLSSGVFGVTSKKTSDFGSKELEHILKNGVDNPTYSQDNLNPNGYISSDRKTAIGFGLSGDFRIGIGYTNNKISNKIAFGASTGYYVRAWAALSVFTDREPNDNEYFQSTQFGDFVFQHGPYFKAQINW